MREKLFGDLQGVSHSWGDGLLRGNQDGKRESYVQGKLPPGGWSDKSYMVQRINTYAFKEPEKVMSNIDIVTEHIRAKSPEKISLHFHHTAGRQNYISDESGFWRLFNYVPSVTYNTTEKRSTPLE